MKKLNIKLVNYIKDIVELLNDNKIEAFFLGGAEKPYPGIYAYCKIEDNTYMIDLMNENFIRLYMKSYIEMDTAIRNFSLLNKTQIYKIHSQKFKNNADLNNIFKSGSLFVEDILTFNDRSSFQLTNCPELNNENIGFQLSVVHNFDKFIILKMIEILRIAADEITTVYCRKIVVHNC